MCLKQGTLYKRCGHVYVTYIKCAAMERESDRQDRSIWCPNKSDSFEKWEKCRSCKRKDEEKPKVVPFWKAWTDPDIRARRSGERDKGC